MAFLGLGAYNTSILAIPAYYALALAPHAYAIVTATDGSISKWDNRCPRATELKTTLQSKMSEADYSRYERAEGAHANAMENLPLFASAVIVGNMAGLKKGGWTGMNAFVAAWFGLRVAHTASYIWLSDDQSRSWIRTALYNASLAPAFYVLIKAAKVLGTAGM